MLSKTVLGRGIQGGDAGHDSGEVSVLFCTLALGFLKSKSARIIHAWKRSRFWVCMFTIFGGGEMSQCRFSRAVLRERPLCYTTHYLALTFISAVRI